LILQHLFGWSMNWESERALCLPGMGLVLFDCTRIVFVWTRGATNREHPCWSSPVFSTWNTSAGLWAMALPTIFNVGQPLDISRGKLQMKSCCTWLINQKTILGAAHWTTKHSTTNTSG
jgi:hypothetical protein